MEIANTFGRTKTDVLAGSKHATSELTLELSFVIYLISNFSISQICGSTNLGLMVSSHKALGALLHSPGLYDETTQFILKPLPADPLLAILISVLTKQFIIHWSSFLSSYPLILSYPDPLTDEI